MTVDVRFALVGMMGTEIDGAMILEEIAGPGGVSSASFIPCKSGKVGVKGSPSEAETGIQIVIFFGIDGRQKQKRHADIQCQWPE